MVEQCKAWKASDGKMFATEDEARRYEIRLGLVGLGLFNEGTINAIMNNSEAVIAALSPMKGLPAVAKHD